MMKSPLTMRLTASRARELLRYDPTSPSGLRWRVGRGGRAAGEPAGTIAYHRNGKPQNWQVEIDYVLYKAHRVIWLIRTGDWPSGPIDHRDRNGLHNQWSNLRDSTHKQNARNRSPGRNNKTGVVGVHPLPDGKFGAGITVDGKTIGLGRFPSLREAARARRKAERIHFGEFAPSMVPSLDDMAGTRA